MRSSHLRNDDIGGKAMVEIHFLFQLSGNDDIDGKTMTEIHFLFQLSGNNDGKKVVKIHFLFQLSGNDDVGIALKNIFLQFLMEYERIFSVLF